MIEYRYDCPFKFTGKIDKLRSISVRRNTPRRIASSFRRLPTGLPARKTSRVGSE